MAKYRIDRINEEIKRELAGVLREVKDPRVPEMISIVAVKTTPDLKYCKVLVSFFTSDVNIKEALKGLNSSAGFIRRELGNRVLLRTMPAFTFEYDDSIAYGAHISQLIHQVMDQEKPQQEEEEE
ncbi:MAG: 30S ribosome-binding factor RbfA [Eubacteriales bacterium]|jgi:ribosome-binding factor A